MDCPLCNGETKVIDKRDLTGATRRRRECLRCKNRFTTYERIELVELMVAKHDGRREPFDHEKVRAGIRQAVKKRPVNEDQIEAAIEAIEGELRSLQTREVTSDQVGTLVMKHLKALDQVAFIRFASVYHSFADVASFQNEIERLLEEHARPTGPKTNNKSGGNDGRNNHTKTKSGRGAAPTAL